MTSIQGSDNLCKYPPYELLCRKLAGRLQILDDCPQVSAATVFHIDVQVLAVLQMFSMEIADDVGVLERRQYREFGI